MTTNFFAFIIVLGVLIFVHELGHFIVARFFGVGVLKFSLGFGPKIFGKTIGLTDYRVSAIPLGGYVKMVGEEPDEELEPSDIPFSFTHKSLYKRFCIVAAGPVFNILLAVFIFYLIYLFSGVMILKSVVGSVSEDTPAYRAGLKKGDIVTAIDGVAVSKWDEMRIIIAKSKGKSIIISISRNEMQKNMTLTPEKRKIKDILGEEEDVYVIGITASNEFYTESLSFFGAFLESIKRTYEITELTILSIVRMIQGKISAKTLGGPIMIAQMAGEQAKAGVLNLAFFIALISINLGILNFLPIPVLDGGHLMFFTIEAVMKRPVSQKVREVSQQVGMGLLLLLMVFVFYNDFARIFN